MPGARKRVLGGRDGRHRVAQRLHQSGKEFSVDHVVVSDEDVHPCSPSRAAPREFFARMAAESNHFGDSDNKETPTNGRGLAVFVWLLR